MALFLAHGLLVRVMVQFFEHRLISKNDGTILCTWADKTEMTVQLFVHGLISQNDGTILCTWADKSE